MNTDNYISLIYKQLKGEISLEEQTALDIWMSDDPANEKLAEGIESDWAKSKNYKPQLTLDLDTEFSALQKRIATDAAQPKQEATIRQLQPKSPNRRQWLGWAVAAVAILAFGINWLVNLPDELEWIALETKAGEQKEIQLADGSTVILNENSKLEYPKEFSGENRPVQLSGEAFFDIQKNPNKAFIIETKLTDVTVLGTSFNVRAYDSEAFTEVAVKTGKVQVRAKSNNKRTALVANQTATFDVSTNTLQKADTPSSNAHSWQTGLMQFSRQPLEKVLEDLQRRFQFDVSLKNTQLKNCKFDGTFPNAKAQDILEDIAANFQATLSKDEKGNYVLSGGNCKDN